MPQSWQAHWNSNPPLLPDDAAARNKSVHSLGNLTLVTQKLNGPLAHRPWTDEAASIAAPTGRDAGLGKHSLLKRYSLLVLNKDIVDNHPTEWGDADIAERGVDLSAKLCLIWPRHNEVEAQIS